MKASIEEAQFNQEKYAGGNYIKFKVEDHMQLSTKYMKSARSSKKLDYQYIGLYNISKVIN